MATLDCGHAESAHDEKFTNGYATERDTGRKVCYDCAADADRRLLTETGRVFAYVSSDGERLTTWSGIVLGRITRAASSRNNFGARVVRVWGCINGHNVYGMGGGSGMCITLRKIR